VVVEEVYTDAFDARVVDWTETGASPYLNNSDLNYITTATDAKEEGDWTFPTSAGGGSDVINSVKLRLESKVTVIDCGDVDVYVWNGATFVLAGTFTPNTTYAWFEIDVSAILTTWAEINGAEVYVHYVKSVTGTCAVRRLTRKVDYTVATGGQQLFTLINQEDY